MIRKILWVVTVLVLLSSAVSAKETLVIAGAGPSTKVVSLFFENFKTQPAAANYAFIVPEESIKHAGGIKHTYKNLFGRTGRPLNEAEQGFDRKEIFLAMMPIAFATGREVKVDSLSLRELEMIFRKQITNWKKLGGPDAEITNVGREPTEALFTELKRYYTFFHRAEFDVILNKDNEVVDLLESPLGFYAIAFGAKANLSHLNQVTIEEDLNTGVRLGLVYDAKYDSHPLVQAVKAYAQSEEWKKRVTHAGMYPVN